MREIGASVIIVLSGNVRVLMTRIFALVSVLLFTAFYPIQTNRSDVLAPKFITFVW